jgi:hypothetical protein
MVAMVAMLPTIPTIPSINRGNFIMFKAYGGINQSSPTIPKAKFSSALGSMKGHKCFWVIATQRRPNPKCVQPNRGN